jgi:hypothetical protein
MDTTSVNFAISKLSSMFMKIHPTLGDLTSDFIQYTMMSQITNHIASFIMIFVCYFLWKPLYKKAKKSNCSYRYDDFGEPWFFLPTVILAIMFFGSVMFVITEIPNTILAISCPEMFTIQSIIKQ